MGTQKRHTAEQIIVKLREADVELGRGVPVGQIYRKLEMSEHTDYRWRKAYGGLKVDQAKRCKELEAEHARLKRLVAEQALDNAILREAATGHF